MRDLRLDHRVLLTDADIDGRTRVGSACGKAILLGEHLVVHGAPALAVPLRNRQVTVRLRPAAEVDPSALGEHAPILRAMIARLGLDPDRIGAEVEASLPMAAGLGSSAALAVALVRATGERDVEVVRARAHDLEHLTHGRPSGIDDAVVSYEQPILFEAGRITRLAGARVPPLWVATVARTRSTREAVAAVGQWAAANRDDFAAMVARVRVLVAGAREALEQTHDDRALGAAMDENQALLERLGVVDPRQTELVTRARAAGALGAKVTGAGFGGAILALAPLDAALERVLGDVADQVFFAGAVA